jgi:hypothetical protein
LTEQRKTLYERAKSTVDDALSKDPGAWRETEKIWKEFDKESAPIGKEYAKVSKKISELWNTTDYVSSSEQSLETMRQDGASLKKAKAKAQRKMRNELTAALNDAYDPKTKSYDTLNLGSRQGLTIAQRNAIKEISRTGKGTSPTAVIKKLFDDNEIQEITRRKLSSKLFHDDDQINLDSMPKALRGIGERLNERSGGDMFTSDKINLLMASEYRDPSAFLKVAELATGQTGMVDDLAGSMTKNEIGRGHSDDYYYDESRQSVETFANVFNFLSSGDPLDAEISKHLAPGYTRYVKLLLDQHNRGQ